MKNQNPTKSKKGKRQNKTRQAKKPTVPSDVSKPANRELKTEEEAFAALDAEMEQELDMSDSDSSDLEARVRDFEEPTSADYVAGREDLVEAGSPEELEGPEELETSEESESLEEVTPEQASEPEQSPNRLSGPDAPQPAKKPEAKEPPKPKAPKPPPRPLDIRQANFKKRNDNRLSCEVSFRLNSREVAALNVNETPFSVQVYALDALSEDIIEIANHTELLHPNESDYKVNFEVDPPGVGRYQLQTAVLLLDDPPKAAVRPGPVLRILP